MPSVTIGTMGVHVITHEGCVSWTQGRSALSLGLIWLTCLFDLLTCSFGKIATKYMLHMHSVLHFPWDSS